MSKLQTELAIVYDILNTVRNGEHNNDEAASERLIRSYLWKYRAESLRKFYNNGVTVDDQVIQTKTLTFTKINNTEFECKIPKIVQLENHYGFYLQINGIDVPICKSEYYSINKKSMYNKTFVQSKTDYNKIILYTGVRPNTLDQNSEPAFLIENIYSQIYDQEIANINGNTNNPITIQADLKAVFFCPDDADGYNWQTDIFPMPGERIFEITQQVEYKEFGFMREAKKDEVQNSRADDVRYHDNENVNE